MDYTTMIPAKVRELIREGKITGPTAGMCAGYAQANLAVMPKELAYDFLLFTQRNPKSCPILEVSDVGSRELKYIAKGADIARDIPKYRREIGCVFQDFRLLKDRNIYDNVAFALKVVGESNAGIQEKVPKMLSTVGLAAKYRSFPKEISGGEQQRVAIARALVNHPSIILADEPTGNLDKTNAWEIMKLLEEINEKGTTVIVVTHNTEIVEVMKKRVITIQKGVVVSDVKPEVDNED